MCFGTCKQATGPANGDSDLAFVGVHEEVAILAIRQIAEPHLRVRKVVHERIQRIAVIIDTGDDLEAMLMKSDTQPAAAGEKVDDGDLRQRKGPY